VKDQTNCNESSKSDTSHWRQIPLSDAIGTIRNGINCKQSRTEEGDAVSRIETIADGKINLQKVGRAVLSDDQKQKFILRPGDILFSHINSAPHVGKCAVVQECDEPLFHGVNLLLMRAAEGVLPEFLHVYLGHLHSQGFWRSRCKQSVNQASVNQQDVKKVLMPLPPLEEQKRIVAVLDQAFAALDRARAHAEANLADAHQLGEIFLDEQITLLFEKFGCVRIDRLASVKGGKRLPKGEKASPNTTPFPYISVRDMTEAGTICVDTVQYISEAAQKSIKRYTISSADIYVSIAGTIAKTGTVPESLDGANLTENAAKLVLSEEWDRDFVYWATRSSNFREQAIAQTRTAAQPKLALERLGSITIPNADPEDQIKLRDNMVRFRTEISQIKGAYDVKLADIASLRQSLLQKAFSGQLT